MNPESENKKPKEISIKDFPILMSTQFFFVEQTPMRNELMAFIHETDKKSEMGINKSKWPQQYKIADHILFDRSKPLVFKTDLIKDYEQEVIDNARSYMRNFIKMTSIQRAYHLTIIAWFVEKLVDIQKTAEKNHWKI